MKRWIIFLGVLTLTACQSPSAPVTNNQNMQASASADTSLDSSGNPWARPQDNTYSSYRDGVIGNGKPALLFFSSKNDPFSDKTNSLFLNMYQHGHFTLSTYRIDKESAPDLSRRYIVVLGDTVVLIDGNGDSVASQFHPTEADIKDLLSRF